MADIFRIGVIGAGAVSDGYHAPVLSRMPGVRLEWVFDLDRAKAADFATRHGISRSVSALRAAPAVDAVLIAIPVGVREESLSVVFERGWHAFIEKPFATTLVSHDDILARAQRAGVRVGVGLMRRFFRGTLAVRGLLRSGVFGRLLRVWAAEGGAMRGSGRGDDWYQNDPAASGGGALIETGSHLIDQAFHICDARGLDALSSETRLVSGIDLDSRLRGSFLREGQSEPVRFDFAVSRVSDLCPGHYFRLEKATLRLPLGVEAEPELLDGALRPVARLQRRERGADAIYQAFYLEWEAFIEECRSGVPGGTDPRTARLSTRLIEEAYARAGAGAP